MNRLMKQYRGCLTWERVNYHKESSWHRLVGPIGSPEFVLLDAADAIVYRWFGVTEASEFEEIIKPLCG